MKDQLEDFIRQNRAAFDDKEPSNKVWRNIKSSMPFSLQRTTVWNSLVVWRVAAIVFMALSVYLLIPKNVQRAQTGKIALKEFNDVEAFYIKEISQKIELIDELQKSEKWNEFTQDFQQLEAMYMVLKEEMKARPTKKVKDALVLNLLVRINLLNQQLHKLDKDYKAEGAAESNI